MSVNIAPGALFRLDLPETIAEVERSHHPPPSRLGIEVTEGAVAGGDPEVVVALSAVGGGLAALAIDDFGTGHSSLARLDKLPVNVLKLDRDLVQRVSRPETRAIIAAIAQMAHALQMSVIAEGVEDGSTLALVKEIGCDAVQGHFLSEPIPPERVPDYLRSHGVEPGPG